jgi:hypothetical protein
MDAFLFFLIRKDADLTPFEFKIPMFMWDGIDYPQGPPECRFVSIFKLLLGDENLKGIVKSIIDRLPYHYKKTGWQFIEVIGDGVHIYRDTLYRDEKKEETDFSLKDLIYTMLHNKPIWAVGFERDCDDGFQVREGDMEDIMIEMYNSLKRINNADFLLYK